MTKHIHKLLLLALVALAFFACRTGPAVDFDADPPELGPANSISAAGATPGLRRYVSPDPSVTVNAKTGTDALYIKGSTTNKVVRDTKYVVDDGRAGVITDVGAQHNGFLVENVIVRDADLWGFQFHGMQSVVFRKVLVRNSEREHGGYTRIWGTALFEDVTAINCAAQGWQVRLEGNRGDPHWADEKRITFTRFTALECGQLRGAGRAGFALSIKDSGPNSDVVIDDVLIRTIRQDDVYKNSSGVWCESFGGICVEFCRSVTITGGYVEMEAPSAREAVQLFDYANNAADNTGPQNIVVDGLTIAQGGCIAVRLGDADSITIKNCISLGGGKIKLFARDAKGVWRLSKSVPLEAGWNS